MERILKRDLPRDLPIGESWEVVDREGVQSIISEGRYAGCSLRRILESHSREIMGPNYPANRPFPILVKWLDCRERLSLQVHPPAAVASLLGGEPKTEFWYILEAEGKAALLLGFKKGVTRDQFRRALEKEALEPLIHRLRVEAGDSIFVPSGRIHAIDSGNFILEIQQNSDTTYRVYDWGRKGLEGEARSLQVEESIRSIDFEDFEPAPNRSKRRGGVLADSSAFRVREHHLKSGLSALAFKAGEQPRLLHVVKGGVRERNSGVVLEKGTTVLLPFAGSFSFLPRGEAVLLLTDNFV